MTALVSADPWWIRSFEAHGDFVALLTHILGDPIQQVGSRVVAHAGAGPAAVFHQVVIKQNQKGVGMEERALLVVFSLVMVLPVPGWLWHSSSSSP